MNSRSSTFRSALDGTQSERFAYSQQTGLQKSIVEEWQQSDEPDLVSAIERHPQLLNDRSFLLDLAIEEYRSRRRREKSLDLQHHCRRFRRFGNSIERSIFRQLETQQYIDEHPDLLAMLGQPKWPEAGDSLAGFQILEQLGSGGIARVYLCQEPDVGNRQIVVKATPFCGSEASVLGRLNHPNIVPILSTGVSEEQGLQYLCMPYLGRSTLADLIDLAFQEGVPRDSGVILDAAKRWLPPHELPPPAPARFPFSPSGTYVGGITTIGFKLADALAYAHDLGILHGDLKPSNVLLTTDARPLLLDFNLSHDGDGAEPLCGGTLSYMPPEHLAKLAARPTDLDEPASCGPASEVYSFGALMYELLTGTTPAPLPRDLDDLPIAAAALLQRLEQGIASIRRSNKLVSRKLDRFILRCLAVDPTVRPASMADVKQALGRELRLSSKVRRQFQSRPRRYSLLIASLVGLGAASGFHLANRPPQHLRHYMRASELALAGDSASATEHYTEALAANPDFRDAQFQRGRVRMTLGQFDLAMNDFGQLVRKENDAESMAYLGYCFNLLGEPGASIAWYDRLHEQGVESTAVYNNLGASYLLTRGRLTRRDSLETAEECFSKALESLGSSDVVQLNLFRLEALKTSSDPNRHPFEAWRLAEALLDAHPNDPVIQWQVGTWYAAVVNSEATADASTPEPERSTAADLARQRFERLIAFKQVERPPGVLQRRASVRESLTLDHRAASARYYIEPALD